LFITAGDVSSVRFYGTILSCRTLKSKVTFTFSERARLLSNV